MAAKSSIYEISSDEEDTIPASKRQKVEKEEVSLPSSSLVAIERVLFDWTSPPNTFATSPSWASIADAGASTQGSNDDEWRPSAFETLVGPPPP